MAHASSLSGIPFHDIQNAKKSGCKAFRGSRVNIRILKNWILKNQPPTIPDLSPKPVPKSQQGDEKREDLYGVLARATRAEMVAYDLLGEAVSKNAMASMISLTKAHREAVRGRLDAESAIYEMQKVSGEVIARDQAMALLNRYLGKVNSLLDTMASSVSGRANPADPELAKAAIQESVDQIKQVISSSKGENERGK